MALLSKPCVEVRNLYRDSNIRINKNDVRRVPISCHLMPKRLDGFYAGKKASQPTSCKLKFVRTLLIDNYDSYTYNIYQELCIINGIPPVVVRNDQWTWNDALYYLYGSKAFDNIVISPGPGSPTRAADVGICLQLLLECKDIPILGICLGHQALGYVHGAYIIHAPEPVHGRLSEIEHNGCSLFNGVPSGRNSGFKAVRYHSLVIDLDSLPSELLPIAWSVANDTLPFINTQYSEFVSCTYKSQIKQNIDLDSFSTLKENKSSRVSPHFKGLQRSVLMGIMHSTRPHYGLQFHPESIATFHGRQIFKNFKEITVDYWLGLRSLSISNQTVHNAANDIFCRPLGTKFLRLNWRKFDCLAVKAGGAQNIFCRLFGDYEVENTFWLDSSSTEKERARYSFMGGKGGPLWRQVTFRLSDRSDKGGGYLSIVDSQGSIKNTYLEVGFFEFLDKELQSFCYNEKDFEGLPFEFYGGYIGYIGYDLKAECGMPSSSHKSRFPDACLFFVDCFLVIDHHLNDVYILSLDDGKGCNNSQWLDSIEQKLVEIKSPRASINPNLQSPNPGFFDPCAFGFVADKSKQQYIEDIQRCLGCIRDGESYELCLTTQIRRQIGDIDILGLYLKLREENPAPYAAWLYFSNENICICCSSPERFLHLDKRGVLEAKPIKGTMARGSTTEEDERFKLQLQYSEKAQAENLMIVDLLRNDLSRVCEAGSVHVPRLMDIESYSTVHTMVSTIRGKKHPKRTPMDCIRAAFPGGSMTGAPKKRSVEILDSLENCSRGVYSGCIGFFSYNQTFDLNIVIRSVVLHEDEASIGAGGAIVALSDPEMEFEEMVLKTRAPARAVIRSYTPPGEVEIKKFN